MKRIPTSTGGEKFVKLWYVKLKGFEGTPREFTYFKWFSSRAERDAWVRENFAIVHHGVGVEKVRWNKRSIIELLNIIEEEKR